MTKVSVTPEVFSFVSYDSGEIAAVVRDLAERLVVANPIIVAVDETTPLSRMSAMLLDADGDATISIRVQSGALEDTRRFTNFSATNAALSLGRMLLRARDRLRDDFVDAPADSDLSLAENAAWDAYCAGRLERVGLAPNEQRFRYNFRNRFGFADDVDTTFDRLWAADDLGWHDLPRPTSDLD
ncbi:MAG: hypothetical protein ACE37B_13525 [Ilumatobacter sp.]|uniref:hypothetical protein n=1 Tax=Ilumatobacter sp. TaxID=1967498 RepID=UPI00391A9A75